MKKSKRAQFAAVAILLGTAVSWSWQARADQVVADDLIVQGSTCIGLECVNNESFGGNTLVLKDQDLRIFFNDTSVTAGFPANKWQITVNDSANGGANYFAVDDITAARQIFRLTAGAPANSLFMASNGKLGFRTATPLLDLHMATSDTPAIRFEQTNAGGFTAQTWDIGANEANFFVRDLTGGSRLPFRIRPGAPTSSVDISASGFVGVGTASPAANLHVASTTTPKIAIQSTAAHASTWTLSSASSNGTFSIADATTNTSPFRVFQGAPDDSIKIAANGKVTVSSLPNCTNGIRTNANGALSCMPASRGRAGAMVADDASDDGLLPTFATVPGAGDMAGHKSSARDRASESKRQRANAASCQDADMSGSWSMFGNTVEGGAKDSVMWCDIQLNKASGANYSMTGQCRTHSTADAAPKSYSVRGERSITVTPACKLTGNFRISDSAESVTGTIMESRIEGDGQSRAVGLTRWQRGKAASLQTFVMQR
jgi:hypothetical protein